MMRKEKRAIVFNLLNVKLENRILRGQVRYAITDAVPLQGS